MRAFHTLVAATSVLPIVGLLILDTLAVRSKLPVLISAALFPSALLLATLSVMLARNRSFRRNFQRYLGAVIDVSRFPEFAKLRAEAARLLRRPEQDIEFRSIVKSDVAPAQIFEGPDKKIYCLLRFELLQVARRRPSLTTAIIWHEFGHYFQWDTKFGYWTLTAIDRFCQYTLWFAGAAALYVFSVIGHLALQHRTTTMDSYVVILEVTDVLFLFAVLWFMRYWRRFAEVNADLLPAVAGYGEPLASYLSSGRPQASRLRMLIALHPGWKARVDAIQDFLSRVHAAGNGFPQQPRSPDCNDGILISATLRLPDYAYGVFVHVAPLWLLFSVMAFAGSIFTARVIAPMSTIEKAQQTDSHQVFVWSTFDSAALDLQWYDVQSIVDDLEFHAQLVDVLHRNQKAPALAFLKQNRTRITKLVRAREAAASSILSYPLPQNLPDDERQKLLVLRDCLAQVQTEEAGAYRVLLAANERNLIEVLRDHLSRLERSSDTRRIATQAASLESRVNSLATETERKK